MMKLITVAGPPSAGKTSVLLKAIRLLRTRGATCGVAKFDCLTCDDAERYASIGVEALTGLSGGQCPDHFYAVNISGVLDWGVEKGFSYLITETAGLCNRCSPHIEGGTGVCVLDALAGIGAPAKIGPYLRCADIVAITKGDIISQAEREVFALRVRQLAPGAKVLFVNGVTGQGVQLLADLLDDSEDIGENEFVRLKCAMPSAVCSFCIGEKRVARQFQAGNVISLFDDGFPIFSLPSETVAQTCDCSQHSIGERHRIASMPVDEDNEILLKENRFDRPMRERAIEPVVSIIIEAGTDKSGCPEAVRRLEIRSGEVVCLLGKTGAGKSRLLNDLGVLAQGDTPSGRRVLVNGHLPGEEMRYELASTMIAQLSQNMHFVMDLSVWDFLMLHAESRSVVNQEELVAQTISCANELAGEPFTAETALTDLSGGQSRALMVADIALVSASPVVLLDEIENAGIDKHRALAVLTEQGKITVISTHDPVLALSGGRRVIINNGAMSRVLVTTDAERRNLDALRDVDVRLDLVRASLRAGDLVEEELAF